MKLRRYSEVFRFFAQVSLNFFNISFSDIAEHRVLFGYVSDFHITVFLNGISLKGNGKIIAAVQLLADDSRTEGIAV